MEGMDMNSDSESAVYNGTDPWYLRTLPGRTGDFIGHFVPGVCYGALGLGLLLLAFYRAQTLPPGKSFAELHIPESDPWFLRWFGLATMAGTVVGSIYEYIDKDPGFDTTAFTHCTLYASFFIMGLCAIYESKGRLPLDTHRAAMVIAFITQALIWHAHGTMKKLPADASLHLLLSYMCTANAAIIAYSMRFNDSVIAYLGGWALILLQGLWIFIAGLYECCITLHMHEIPAILSLLGLIIFLGIVLVVGHCGPKPSDQDLAKYRGNFSVLASDSAEDEEEQDGCKPIV